MMNDFDISSPIFRYEYTAAVAPSQSHRQEREPQIISTGRGDESPGTISSGSGQYCPVCPLEWLAIKLMNTERRGWLHLYVSQPIQILHEHLQAIFYVIVVSYILCTHTSSTHMYWRYKLNLCHANQHGINQTSICVFTIYQLVDKRPFIGILI